MVNIFFNFFFFLNQQILQRIKTSLLEVLRTSYVLCIIYQLHVQCISRLIVTDQISALQIFQINYVCNTATSGSYLFFLCSVKSLQCYSTYVCSLLLKYIFKHNISQAILNFINRLGYVTLFRTVLTPVNMN